ncbi:recombination protein O N-terminal domain-containing protein, partial [Pelagibacteraceae bacterium]|nr:recombination protein O N-terminal domain-containing protein [Pelagibacteraceae bacterium]
MNWEDECFLLSKRKFRENANIINVFTLNKGKVGGIVYGGSSRKIRNYLQISNKLFIFHNSKNDNKIGYFKAELIKAITPLYFNDRERTSALISLCS